MDEDIFGALNYYCDVEDEGEKYIAKRTGTTGADCIAAYRLFQAFVRQGQNFYSSAAKLHHRASPLFYYYAFLNLAKASIALKTPNVFKGDVGHGLTHRYSESSDFATQSIEIKSGVFPILYKTLTELELPRPCSFHVSTLLGYLSDIGFEYESAGLGVPCLLPVKLRLLVNQRDGNPIECWPVIAIGQKTKLIRRDYALTVFFEYFDEIELSKETCERVFEISAMERLMYRFFQSKTVYKSEDENHLTSLRSDLQKAIARLYMPNVFRDEADFFLSIPTEDKPDLPMNEFLAGYLLFFYLGSLVRYHPDYLERILHSKEAWIIQRFTTSCATTLLRHASIFLLGENHVLCPR